MLGDSLYQESKYCRWRLQWWWFCFCNFLFYWYYRDIWGTVKLDNSNKEMSFRRSGSVNLGVDTGAIKMSVAPGRQTVGPPDTENASSNVRPLVTHLTEPLWQVNLDISCLHFNVITSRSERAQPRPTVNDIQYLSRPEKFLQRSDWALLSQLTLGKCTSAARSRAKKQINLEHIRQVWCVESFPGLVWRVIGVFRR